MEKKGGELANNKEGDFYSLKNSVLILGRATRGRRQTI